MTHPKNRLFAASMAQKKKGRTAVPAASTLEPQDQSTLDFGSNRLGMGEEEATCIAPAAKSVGVMFSNDDYEGMPKASFSAAFDEELPEVGKPDTDHDLSLIEEEKHSADTFSSRSSDAVYVGKTPSLAYFAATCTNELRYSSFAKREHLGESDHN